MKSDFRIYHPVVNLIYCIAVVFFTMFFMNPVFIVISFGTSFFCASYFRGMENVRKYFKGIFIIAAAACLINPLFNHRGSSVLTYLPTGNPVTLESMIFGVFSGLIISGVIVWFYGFNELMPTDKVIYLFGGVFPMLSLVFSMTVSFVQLLKTRLFEINSAQRAFYLEGEKPVKKALISFKVILNRSLEESVETAVSMRGRGFGLKGRTSFSIYNFEEKDAKAAAVLMGLSAAITAGILNKSMNFFYFDKFAVSFSIYGIICSVCFGLICMFPFLVR